MFVNFSEETRHLLKQAEKERDELHKTIWKNLIKK